MPTPSSSSLRESTAVEEVRPVDVEVAAQVAAAEEDGGEWMLEEEVGMAEDAERLFSRMLGESPPPQPPPSAAASPALSSISANKPSNSAREALVSVPKSPAPQPEGTSSKDPYTANVSKTVELREVAQTLEYVAAGDEAQVVEQLAAVNAEQAGEKVEAVEEIDKVVGVDVEQAADVEEEEDFTVLWDFGDERAQVAAGAGVSVDVVADDVDARWVWGDGSLGDENDVALTEEQEEEIRQAFVLDGWGGGGAAAGAA